MKSGTFLSVVVPLQNDGKVLEPFVAEVMQTLADGFQHYELVLVDDRSSDDTLSVASRLLKKFPAIRLIRLSRRFGSDIAVTAGLESSIGDFVIVMRADSDPPREIPRLVQLAKDRGDADVFLGVATNPIAEPLVFRGLRTIFRFVATRLGMTLPRITSTFCGLTRRAVNAMTRVKQKQRYVSLLCCSIGFEQATFSYEKQYRTARPRQRGLREAVDVGLASLIASSTSPLRFVSYTGCVAAALNLAYVGYVFVINLFKSQVAEGWTTLSLQSSTMFLLNFVILVVMSEYISHILEESQDRPLYHIADEQGSTVVISDPSIRNVQEHSVSLPAAEERKHAA